MRVYPLPLQSRDRAELRRAGQRLTAAVTLGKAGPTEAVIQSVRECLDANELIKVRLARECPLERPKVATALAAAVEAECAGQIGRTFLLWVRARMTCHLASHLYDVSGRSPTSEILEMALLFLRFRRSAIDQIRGTSGRQNDKLFLREPFTGHRRRRSKAMMVRWTEYADQPRHSLAHAPATLSAPENRYLRAALGAPARRQGLCGHAARLRGGGRGRGELQPRAFSARAGRGLCRRRCD
ncbi:MAG: hypothetical protein CME06_08105 [Gemmatimonadetes bacterium]|nr:hypothetical protein [Gemmatimonadota bacterium]